jgi:hypothetical protein
MPEFRSSSDAPPPESAAHCNRIRGRILPGLVLFTLVRTGEVLAGDPASIANPTRDSFGKTRLSFPSGTPMIAVPGDFTSPAAADIPVFSATDFRPRKHTVFDRDPAVNTIGDAPMLGGTTVWQRMAEYKSHDRVRLLTLWESSGSTISVQAGRRGNPSLQWTSRLMNRDGSTRGLLDRLFSVSLVRAGYGLRNSTRLTNAPATPKPVSSPAAAGLK